MGAARSSPSRRPPEPRRGLLLAAALAALGLAGCPRPASRPPGPVPVVVSAPEPAARTALFERIAGLLAPRRAAGPDYVAAQAEIERYLAAEPAEGRRPEIAALRTLLSRAAVAARPAPSPAPPPAAGAAPDPRVGELEAEAGELRARLERLGKENEELRAVVERLKELDVDMEQKRRRVR